MLDIAMVDVALNGATGVDFTWKDPGTIEASSPTQIALEWEPIEVSDRRSETGGTRGAYTISATATGGDTSTIRITGKLWSNGRPPN